MPGLYEAPGVNLQHCNTNRQTQKIKMLVDFPKYQREALNVLAAWLALWAAVVY